ncbi:MAG: hypothetical protein LBK60_11460 [Verrucomicrobiales bacterium]|nr:hypothetical protein [Verrucomicrobiales bacterium]
MFSRNLAAWRLGASFFLLAATVSGAELIKAADVDGRERVLNEAGKVHVVIYSNEDVQDRTRAAGRALDEFQGLPEFRSVVVVDLRDSLANLAKSYTQRRMVRDLDAEALRVTPFYRKNGNAGDPRREVSAVADFSGELSVRLGWREPAETLRVIVFDRHGREAARWEDLKDYRPLTLAVKKLLSTDGT